MKFKKLIALAIAVLTITMAFTSTAFASYADISDWPTKRKGDNDNYVRALQTIIKYNRSSSLQNDGQFGDDTYSAVKSYQSKYGLSSDGIVGPNTWASLDTKLYPEYVTYYQYQYYIKIGTTQNHTNLKYFYCQGYDAGSKSYWKVYKAAPGDEKGQWYVICTA